MFVLYIITVLSAQIPGGLPVVKNPETDCPHYDMHTCSLLSLCVWECEESKCVQTSDANSACNRQMSPMMGGMPGMQPYGGAPGMPGMRGAMQPMGGMTGMPGMHGAMQPMGGMTGMPYQQQYAGAASNYAAGGMRPGFPQTGVQPGYMQPGAAQAGYAPPVQPGAINSGLPPAPQGFMQAGYAQAGIAAQPGYAQPGMAPQRGYSQPGLANAQSAYALPAAGGMMAGAAGYGQPGLAAPGGAYGAAPGYQAGMARPGYGARGAPSPGFGHGAYSPGVRPMLSSIRKTNTTLKQTAYGTGAYPVRGGMPTYPQTYPSRAYPRSGVYPSTGAYGTYGTGAKGNQMYGWPPRKTKKYSMSTTFTYALLIVTPFLIICSFCVGKFVGTRSSTRSITPGNVVSNPDLMQPIHMDNTYYSQMQDTSNVDPEGGYADPEMAGLENQRRSSRRNSKRSRVV